MEHHFDLLIFYYYFSYYYINLVCKLQGSGLSREQHSELVSLLKLLSCLARHLNLNNSSLEDEDEDDGTTRRHSQVRKCIYCIGFYSLLFGEGMYNYEHFSVYFSFFGIVLMVRSTYGLERGSQCHPFFLIFLPSLVFYIIYIFFHLYSF